MEIQELLDNVLGSTRTGRRAELFPTFKFHVEIGSIVEAAFTECSGLEMSTEVKEYQEGGQNGFAHVFPSATKYSRISLKRGFLLTNDIFLWYQEMENCLRSGKPLRLRHVSIILRSSGFGGEMRWNLTDAFPTKWTGPSLRTSEAAVATEGLEFAHHGIWIQPGSSTISSTLGPDVSANLNMPGGF